VGGIGRPSGGRGGGCSRRHLFLFLRLFSDRGLRRLRRCRRLLRRLLRLLGLDVALEALALSLAADAVGLGVLDARRVALDADPERAAQIERLLVGEPELSRQLVYPDPARQLPAQPFLLAL
jgi:hypothetical protein